MQNLTADSFRARKRCLTSGEVMRSILVQRTKIDSSSFSLKRHLMATDLLIRHAVLLQGATFEGKFSAAEEAYSRSWNLQFEYVIRMTEVDFESSLAIILF